MPGFKDEGSPMDDAVRKFLNKHRTAARWLSDIIDVLLRFPGWSAPATTGPRGNAADRSMAKLSAARWSRGEPLSTAGGGEIDNTANLPTSNWRCLPA
jgi:hypothetical protein